MSSDVATSQIDAVIFDMDGVLIDSEPLWHEAEIEAFGRFGLPLTAEQCAQTSGVRVDAVVAHWQFAHPEVLGAVALEEIVGAIINGVVARITSRGNAMNGAVDAVSAVAARGKKLGLASSSPPAVIDAVLTRLGLADAFVDVRSGWWLPRSKPDPAIYLEACAALEVEPARTVAVEDSESGLRSAVSAGLVVCALPDRRMPVPPSVARAHYVLESLRELDDVISALDRRR